MATRPRDPAARFNVADGLYKNGRYDEASSLFRDLGQDSGSPLAGKRAVQPREQPLSEQRLQGRHRRLSRCASCPGGRHRHASEPGTGPSGSRGTAEAGAATEAERQAGPEERQVVGRSERRTSPSPRTRRRVSRADSRNPRPPRSGRRSASREKLACRRSGRSSCSRRSSATSRRSRRSNLPPSEPNARGVRTGEELGDGSARRRGDGGRPHARSGLELGDLSRSPAFATTTRGGGEYREAESGARRRVHTPHDCSRRRRLPGAVGPGRRGGAVGGRCPTRWRRRPAAAHRDAGRFGGRRCRHAGPGESARTRRSLGLDPDLHRQRADDPVQELYVGPPGAGRGEGEDRRGEGGRRSGPGHRRGGGGW